MVLLLEVLKENRLNEVEKLQGAKHSLHIADHAFSARTVTLLEVKYMFIPLINHVSLNYLALFRVVHHQQE